MKCSKTKIDSFTREEYRCNSTQGMKVTGGYCTSCKDKPTLKKGKYLTVDQIQARLLEMAKAKRTTLFK